MGKLTIPGVKGRERNWDTCISGSVTSPSYRYSAVLPPRHSVSGDDGITIMCLRILSSLFSRFLLMVDIPDDESGRE